MQKQSSGGVCKKKFLKFLQNSKENIWVFLKGQSSIGDFPWI